MEKAEAVGNNANFNRLIIRSTSPRKSDGNEITEESDGTQFGVKQTTLGSSLVGLQWTFHLCLHVRKYIHISPISEIGIIREMGFLESMRQLDQIGCLRHSSRIEQKLQHLN